MLEKKLERVHIEKSRLMEYLNVNDLQSMTGLSPGDFHKVIIKELVDNALDACEECGVTPDLSVRAYRENGQYHYAITDNGGGMTEEVIRKILNFETRTSSKEAYRSPTRGAQGNALKTVFGIPVALNQKDTPCSIMFRTKDKEYTITINPNYIADVPEIAFEVNNSQPFLDGTEISLALDLDFDGEEYRGHYTEIYHDMLFGYSLFNPHATFTFNDNVQFKARDAEFIKFLPTDLTSPQWYTEKDFASLIYGLVSDEQDFLRGSETSIWRNGKPKLIWHAQRVELNAMTPEQLIGFIERKLNEHGLTEKVLPDADIVNVHFRQEIRAKLSSRLKLHFEQMLDMDDLTGIVIDEIYKRFRGDTVRYHHVLKKKLSTNPTESWDEIIESAAWKVASKLKHRNADMIKSLAISELRKRLEEFDSLNVVDV